MNAHTEAYKRRKEYIRCMANLDALFAQPQARIFAEIRRRIRRMR